MRFLIALVPLALVACGAPAPDNAAETATDAAANAAIMPPAPTENPQVTHAWVRLPAVPGRPAAAYFTLTGGAGDDAVVAVSTPAAARTELHETMEHDGVMSMQAMENVPLAAGAQMDFAPGGKHVMLFEPTDGLQPGGTVPLTIDFRDGPDVTVQATLVATGGDAPAH